MSPVRSLSRLGRDALIALAVLTGPAAAAQGAPRFELERRALPNTGPALGWAHGDWDGDGDPDAMTVSWFPAQGAWTVRVLDNDGHGHFVARSAGDLTEALAGGVVAGVLPGDLDGDGDLDALFTVVAETLGAAPVIAWLQEPGGSRLVVSDTDLEGTIAENLLGDLDGDGDLDVAVATSAGLFTLVNDGAAGFTRGFTADVSTARDLALADLDGDGDTDLVACSPDLTVFENNGGGSFAPVAILAENANEIDAGDVDGDGDSDLFTRAVFPPEFAFQTALLVNDGAARFQPILDPEFLTGSVQLDHAIEDFERDGDLDLTWAGHVAINLGGGRFAAGVPTPLAGLSAVDVEGDGDTDWIGPDELWLGNDEGSRVPAQEYLSAATRDSLLGDVDGDRDLDTIRYIDGEHRVLLNDGRGVFHTALPPIALPSDYDRPLAFGDLDGDEDLDLYSFNSAATYLNDGAGTFTWHTSCASADPLATIGPGALADFDGDGDLDVFAPTAGLFGGGDFDSLLLNDGTGCMASTGGRLPPRRTIAWNAEAGDLDRDGDLDVVTPDGGYYRNDGAGFFSDAWDSVADHAAVDWVRAGDLDRDGWPDLHFSSSFGDQLLWNDGTGAFPGPPLPGPAKSNRAELADLDGDGRLDLVVGAVSPPQVLPFAAFQGSLEAYRNTGNRGAFERLAVSHVPDYQPAVGDLDGDGDVDLLSGAKAVLNTTRSLTWASFPRFGHPLRMKVAGSPLAPYLLFASRELLPSAVSTSLGLVHLDPAAAPYRRAGTLGLDGTRVLSFPAPDQQSLVGLTVYWQALIGAPAGWSNYEATALIDF